MNVCCRLMIHITNGHAVRSFSALQNASSSFLIPAWKNKSNDALPQNRLSSIWESAVNTHVCLSRRDNHLPSVSQPSLSSTTLLFILISPYRKSVRRASSSDSLMHYHSQVCVFQQEWFTLHSWKCNKCKNVLKIELALACRLNRINTKSKIHFVENTFSSLIIVTFLALKQKKLQPFQQILWSLLKNYRWMNVNLSGFRKSIDRKDRKRGEADAQSEQERCCWMYFVFYWREPCLGLCLDRFTTWSKTSAAYQQMLPFIYPLLNQQLSVPQQILGGYLMKLWHVVCRV